MRSGISEKEYKIKDASKEYLKSKGFYYSSKYSTSEDAYFTSVFGVAYYNKKPVLSAELIVRQSDGNVEVNVFDSNTVCIYPAFYSKEYHSDNKVVESIERRLQSKFKQLGIVRKRK